MILFALGIKCSSGWKRLGRSRALRDKLEPDGRAEGYCGFAWCRLFGFRRLYATAEAKLVPKLRIFSMLCTMQ